MLNIKDYVNMRLSNGRFATTTTYHAIRNLNIKGGGNFQQALSELDDDFDFRFEPSKTTLKKFQEKYITK